MGVDLSRGATLALGGIGVRGVTNIGALMACDQLGLEVKGLRATGISTVIAAYYALGGDPQELIPRLRAFFEAHRRELWGLEAYGGFAPARGQGQGVRSLLLMSAVELGYGEAAEGGVPQEQYRPAIFLDDGDRFALWGKLAEVGVTWALLPPP